MKKVYNVYCKNTSVPKFFAMWKCDMEKESPIFLIWSTTINFQIAALTLVPPFREQNLDLCKAASAELMSWLFPLDHPIYAQRLYAT